MEEIRIQLVCEDADAYTYEAIPCEGKVRLTVCPYEEDVNDRKVPAILCERHEHERAMDI